MVTVVIMVTMPSSECAHDTTTQGDQVIWHKEAGGGRVQKWGHVPYCGGCAGLGHVCLRDSAGEARQSTR